MSDMTKIEVDCYHPARFDKAIRAVCAESCAHRGEPPCWEICPEEWPNPNCDEPGCKWLAFRAIEAWEALSRDHP